MQKRTNQDRLNSKKTGFERCARLRDQVGRASEHAENASRQIKELKRGIAPRSKQTSQLFANMQQRSAGLKIWMSKQRRLVCKACRKRSEQERVLADARHEPDQLTQKLRHAPERIKLQLDGTNTAT